MTGTINLIIKVMHNHLSNRGLEHRPSLPWDAREVLPLVPIKDTSARHSQHTLTMQMGLPDGDQLTAQLLSSSECPKHVVTDPMI